MSTPLPSFAASAAFDDAPGPTLVQPETRRLDGAVREAYVPPLAPPVTHGSLADIPFDNASDGPGRGRPQPQGRGRRWTDVTAAEFAEQVLAVAKGLIAEGLVPGDRLAIMARTTYEWTLLDFAAWAAGLVTVPVYPTSSVFQTRWILQDSGAVALRRGDRRRRPPPSAPNCDRLPDLRHMWVFEKGARRAARRAGRATCRTSEVGVRRGVLGPDTLATLIYTSGTTGRPKGCALTHGNFFAEVDNAIELLYPVFKARTSEEAVGAALPAPCRTSSAAWWRSACLRARVRLGHAPSLKTEDLLADLAAFRPTCLLAIPYMLEKVFNTGPRHGRDEGRGVLLRPRGLAWPARYGEAMEARQHGDGRRPRRGAEGRPAPSTTRSSTAVSATPWAAGSGTRSAAAPRSAAASPRSTPARASRSTRATA